MNIIGVHEYPKWKFVMNRLLKSDSIRDRSYWGRRAKSIYLNHGRKRVTTKKMWSFKLKYTS